MSAMVSAEERRRMRGLAEDVRQTGPPWAPFSRRALASAVLQLLGELESEEAILSTALDTIARLTGVATSHAEMREEIVTHNREVAEVGGDAARKALRAVK